MKPTTTNDATSAARVSAIAQADNNDRAQAAATSAYRTARKNGRQTHEAATSAYRAARKLGATDDQADQAAGQAERDYYKAARVSAIAQADDTDLTTDPNYQPLYELELAAEIDLGADDPNGATIDQLQESAARVTRKRLEAAYSRGYTPQTLQRLREQAETEAAPYTAYSELSNATEI